MSLSAGTRLGPYEIVSPLGAGGMGEVYRARDPRLDRIVAIKVLPTDVADDRDSRARFEREARAVAALDHPHICAVYDIGREQGIDFIVMQYLEGETLSDRLTKGPLPLDQAMRHATQIADAIDKAHRHGVVHRDIKPGNIVLTKEGVKLLDFGLARLMPVGGSPAGMSNLLTEATNLTGKGTIIGTLQYMAPEQLEGRDADARTDIFALGTVLYEMATGRKAFAGTSQAGVISSILSSEPAPIATLLPLTPSGLDHIVKVCLAKDPDERWQSARDVKRELQWIADARPQQTDAIPAITQRRTQGVPPWILGIIAGSIAAGFAVGSLTRPRAVVTREVTRSVIPLPRRTQLPFDLSTIALSPDGRTIVFAAEEDGVSRLYVRRMDSLAAAPIAGTDGAIIPFFSPDGQWVAFWNDSKIKKAALTGGATQVVCDADSLMSAVWSDDDTIFFSPTTGSGLWRVASNGGTPHILTTPNRAEREKTHRSPDVLPGGKAVLLTVGTADITTFDDARIEVLQLATGQRKVLIRGGMNARYVSTGHVIYARSGSLLAVPFDVDRLEVTGPPTVLVEDVFTNPDYGYANFAISRNGSLLYAPGGTATHHNALVWVDRQGRSEPITKARRPFFFARLSPDSQRIAVGIDQATAEIWIYDVMRTTFVRLVYGWDNTRPIWSPDGTRLMFNSNRGTPGGYTLFGQAADGTGAAERLTADARLFQVADSASPDGRFLVFTQLESGTTSDLWMMSFDGRKPRPLINTSASESEARVSLDGRWLAYQSDRSGQDEVYVQAFPGPSRTWQVSLDGGTFPAWAPNGRELFYRKGDQVLAVDIAAATSEFTAGRPSPLFTGPYLAGTFDVARDGRFLMLKEDERQPITQLNLVQNWFDELKARVPTK